MVTLPSPQLTQEQDLLEGVGESAGLGIAGAGPLGGVAGAANTKVSVTPRPGQDRSALNTLAEQALTTGDVSTLLDTSNPTTYNPSLAAEVLIQRTQNTELSTEEQTAAQTNLDEIVTNLQARQQELTEKDPVTMAKEEIQTDIEEILKLKQVEGMTENDQKLLDEELTNRRKMLNDVDEQADSLKKTQTSELQKRSVNI